MDKEREALVRKILIGIDETENESDHGWWETSFGAEFGKNKLDELIAALTAQQEPVAEPAGDTGNQEADKIINRLMSDDPDFDDCIEAAAFIRKLVVDHRGPDGFATWKDAAIAARIKRTAPPSGVQPTDGRASMQAELGAALGSALSHYKSGDMQACAASLVRIVDLFRDTPQPAATWDAHGNSGMRHPEESDVSGGATDCARQPADGVVVPREGMIQAARWLENAAAKSVSRREYLLAATALLAAAKEPRK